MRSARVKRPHLRGASKPPAKRSRPRTSGPARRAAKPARSRAAAPKAPRVLIAVDIGNSETVVGRFRGASLDGFWRLTSTRATGDEIGLRLVSLLGRGGAARADGAVLCSVVPALTSPWAAALARHAASPVVEVDAKSAGIPIRYRDPGVVGPDRLANAVAARALHGLPAIIVDLGTATTFDCISPSGAYLGGVIAPGVGGSAEALFQRAARLPRVELQLPERAIGRTTAESMRAGILWGAAGQVDALVRRIALEMRGTPHVIATGGFAPLVVPACETINLVDEALTLQGMRLIWEAHHR